MKYGQLSSNEFYLVINSNSSELTYPLKSITNALFPAPTRKVLKLGFPKCL